VRVSIMTAELADVLLDDGSRVRCEAVLRELPGKRVVYAGRRNGDAVVAKRYLDRRRADVHARREFAGLAAFAAAGIAAPEIVFDGRDSEGQPVLVVRHIDNAVSLAERWQQADSSLRLALLRACMGVLAAHHAAGICQRDLHPGNFLVAGETVYSIDGDAVDRQSAPLGRRRALRNLALFCAQFLPDTDVLSLEASAVYASARDWSADRLRKRLPAMITAARWRRWRKYRDKLYRECSDIARLQTPAGACLAVRPKAEALAPLLYEPDASCPGDPALCLKDGGTATVWRTSTAAGDVVVKRYNVKSRLHGMRIAAKESRASISWRSAHLLRFFGLATPAPLALISGQRRLFGARNYLVTAALDGESLDAWLDRHRQDEAQVRDLARQVGAVFAGLKALRIAHGDTKATNFVVADGQPWLIDLDAMKVHRSRIAFARAWQRDTRRFLANWRDDATLGDWMRDALAESGVL
jgi:tRNA A-37 threonylcarbamoyl transferase component Bud32